MDMEKLVPMMRDKIKQCYPDATIGVICDNMILSDEKSDVVKWDDANSCLYAVHRSNSEVRGHRFIVIPYSMVQYIEVIDNLHNIAKIGKAFDMDTKKLDYFVGENTTFKL